MYRENVRSINFFVGCLHDCGYCKPSFQRLLKRSRCPQCRSYTPHPHLERLEKTPPKTGPEEFIFFPSCSDWAFIPNEEGWKACAYMRSYPASRFLCQTKNPWTFQRFRFPENAVLAITLETDQTDIAKLYSVAPSPIFRCQTFLIYPHPYKIVTVEPILKFNHERLLSWLTALKPLAVYIGYDNHNCHLEEPRLEETLRLIEELEKAGIQVRRKTLRKAWYE